MALKEVYFLFFKLIFCENEARLKEIDDSLWTYGKNKFIPHATLADKIVQEFGWQRQPVFLTNEEKNNRIKENELLKNLKYEYQSYEIRDFYDFYLTKEKKINLL